MTQAGQWRVGTNVFDDHLARVRPRGKVRFMGAAEGSGAEPNDHDGSAHPDPVTHEKEEG
jgi:hypothetical protein